VLPGEGLGASLALRGSVLAAGTQSAGTIWVFEQAAGAVGDFRGTAVLELPDAGKLGSSLALDGGRLLAGSPTTHATGIQSGAAHLFERVDGMWMPAATLVPPEAMLFARFGAAVALDGPVAVVGAPAAKSGNGAVYVYREQAGTWDAFSTLAALPGAAYSGLGGAFGVSGECLVAGAAELLGPPGVAFALGGFRPWEPLGGGVGGTGGVPALSVQASLCGGTQVTLAVAGGMPSATVLFVVGFEAAPQPFHGGTLWPAPDVLRFGTLDATGAAVLAGTWPYSQPGMQSVYAQAWMTDATAPGGLAATQALRSSTP
jgi:hypothetical protein